MIMRKEAVLRIVQASRQIHLFLCCYETFILVSQGEAYGIKEEYYTYISHIDTSK